MLSDLFLRLRALLKRSAIERELDDELRFHVDHQVEAYVRAGISRDEAQRRARLEFGELDQVKEEYRDALGVRLLDDVRRDLRLAFRSLRATPLATAAAILSAPTGVIVLVLVRVSLLVGVGIVAGTGISIWASKFVGSLIYGLQPREPM